MQGSLHPGKLRGLSSLGLPLLLVTAAAAVPLLWMPSSPSVLLSIGNQISKLIEESRSSRQGRLMQRRNPLSLSSFLPPLLHSFAPRMAMLAAELHFTGKTHDLRCGKSDPSSLLQLSSS